MATPHVSGLASLLVGYNSSLTVNDISNIINLSVDDINYPDDDQIEEGFDVKSGHGRINAERALSYLTAPYSINQWSSSNGTDYGTSGATMVLVGIPNLNNGLYIVVKHEVRKSATFPTSFYNIIGAWGRGVNTNGFSTNNPNYGMGFCEVVPGTLTNTGATLRTYVYQVYTYPNCVYLGYYPNTPSNVTFAYTVLGIVNPTISGPTLICSSPNSTFTLSNRPTGTTVTWRKSNNLTYVSGQGTDNYTVNALSSGPGWIRPTVYFGSDSLTLPQYILWVGTPQFNISGPYEGCPNVQYTFEAIPKPYSNPSYDYSWAIYPNDGYISTSNGGRYAYITFYSVYSVAGYDVKVRAQNTCGLGDYSIGNIWIHECYDFLLSPNPASEILTITKIESESNNSNSKKVVHNDESIIYTIRILDSSGGIHYATKKSGSSFSIPISSLKNGNYIVQIVNGGNRINKQLVIKH